MYKDLKVYVINLPREQIKKKRIKKLLEKFNFNFTFFKAVDGEKENLNYINGYNDLKRKLFFGRSLLKKELGIFESHRKIINEIVEKKIKYGLIFEDDITLHSSFENILKKILNLDYSWDLIRFLDTKKINLLKGRNIINIEDKTCIKRYPYLFGGAHAYLISYYGAKKIIELTKDFYYPIDLIMGQTWKNNLNSLVCNPGMVWQEPRYNIDPKDSTRFLKKNKNFLTVYPFSRFFFKIYESSAKWIFYFYKFFPDLVNKKN